MKLIDTNVLVYAVNAASSKHVESRVWLENALSGQAPVGFAWIAVLGFVRISSNRRLLSPALAVEDAVDLVHEWLAEDSARIISPTERHADLISGLLRAVGTGGNLVNDAHLAALAIEHRAEIVSYDTDFARFPGVRWSTPATA